MKTQRKSAFHLIKLGCIAICMVLIAVACGKESKYSKMRVRVTDDPGDYQQVNVEIKGFQINYSDADQGEDGWVSLNTKAGVYDLLLLQNDISVVLVDEGQIPSGKVEQIRLILGENNSVVVDGVSFHLETPSASESGLKINVNTMFLGGKTYDVLLDFDAGQSIVTEGNGSYKLKPVIRLESIIVG